MLAVATSGDVCRPCESAMAAVVSSVEREERTIVKTSSGVSYADLYVGSGEVPRYRLLDSECFETLINIYVR